MADPYQVMLATVAIVLMVAVPVVCLVLYDLAVGRWDAPLGRWRDSRSHSAERRRNLKALRNVQGVPIEQVAADLRRLRNATANDAHRSAAHQMGNRLAYDRVLIQACDMLDIRHGLVEDCSGMDRDIERIRIEAELEGAGVVISTHRYGQAA